MLRMTLAVHRVRMGVERNEYRVFLVGKLNDGDVYWIKLAKRMDKWWAVTNTVMTLLRSQRF